MHKHTHQHQHTSLADILRSTSGNQAVIVRRVVIIGLIANAILMALKIVTGYYGHSEALVADGFHSLNDFASDLVVLIFIGIAYRKADARYTYGYGKFETFVSLLISAILCVAAVAIFREGVESILAVFKGENISHPDFYTIIVVIVSIVAKELLYRYTSSRGRKTGSSALIANAWHQRSDALASIATLIGVVCSHFFSDKWAILDPCASLFIAIIIAIAGIRMLIPAFRELMERALPQSEADIALGIIADTEGVEGIKDLKSRKNGNLKIFDAAIYVNPDLTISEGYAITEAIRKNLETHFGNGIIISISTYPAQKDNNPV